MHLGSRAAGGICQSRSAAGFGYSLRAAFLHTAHEPLLTGPAHAVMEEVEAAAGVTEHVSATAAMVAAPEEGKGGFAADARCALLVRDLGAGGGRDEGEGSGRRWGLKRRLQQAHPAVGEEVREVGQRCADAGAVPLLLCGLWSCADEGRAARFKGRLQRGAVCADQLRAPNRADRCEPCARRRGRPCHDHRTMRSPS